MADVGFNDFFKGLAQDMIGGLADSMWARIKAGKKPLFCERPNSPEALVHAANASGQVKSVDDVKAILEGWKRAKQSELLKAPDALATQIHGEMEKASGGLETLGAGTVIPIQDIPPPGGGAVERTPETEALGASAAADNHERELHRLKRAETLAKPITPEESARVRERLLGGSGPPKDSSGQQSRALMPWAPNWSQPTMEEAQRRMEEQKGQSLISHMAAGKGGLEGPGGLDRVENWGDVPYKEGREWNLPSIANTLTAEKAPSFASDFLSHVGKQFTGQTGKPSGIGAGDVGGMIGAAAGHVQDAGMGKTGAAIGKVGEIASFAESGALAMAGDPMAMADVAQKGLKLAVDQIANMIEHVGKAADKLGDAAGSDTAEGTAKHLFGAGNEMAHAVLGPLADLMPGLKIPEKMAEAVERLRAFSDQLMKSNFQFAEFSASMAGVQAMDEARRIRLSAERGGRRAESADDLARAVNETNRALAPIEDGLAVLKNYVLAELNRCLVDLMEVIKLSNPVLRAIYDKLARDSGDSTEYQTNLWNIVSEETERDRRERRPARLRP